MQSLENKIHETISKTEIAIEQCTREKDREKCRIEIQTLYTVLEWMLWDKNITSLKEKNNQEV